MSATPWILVAISGIILILGILFWFMRKKEKPPTDYYALFIIGITWMPLGIALENPAFWIMGLVFMAIGLKNKDKWKQNRKGLEQLSPKARRITIALIVLGVIILLAAIALNLILRSG